MSKTCTTCDQNMFIYVWYLLCFKKIHVPLEEDDWGHFVDLDE